VFSGGAFSWGAFCAEAADDQLAFADDALAEGFWCGRFDGVPPEVFYAAAAVADEVVVLLVFGVVTGGAAFGGDLADEAGFYQIAEVVVGGGAGGAWVDAVDGFEDFSGGGMLVVLHEERHDAVALRRAAEAAVFEALAYLLGFHWYLDYV